MSQDRQTDVEGQEWGTPRSPAHDEGNTTEEWLTACGTACYRRPSRVITKPLRGPLKSRNGWLHTNNGLPPLVRTLRVRQSFFGMLIMRSYGSIMHLCASAQTSNERSYISALCALLQARSSVWLASYALWQLPWNHTLSLDLLSRTLLWTNLGITPRTTQISILTGSGECKMVLQVNICLDHGHCPG